MAFDTFDTDAVATAGITFSNGNLTALGITGSTIGTAGIVQTLEGKTAGKWYVEFTCVAVSGNVDGVGVSNSLGVGQEIIGNSPIGTWASNGWGYYTNNQVINQNAVPSSVNNTTWGAGDVIGIAIDLDDKTVWWRKNTGSWVGTSGTPNPATNTGGFSLTNAMASGARIFPAAVLSGASAKFTLNAGATGFTGTVPSGFTSGWTNTTAGTYFGSFATTGHNGDNVQAPPQNDKAVSPYTATLTGSVTSIVVAMGPGAGDIKGVIYDSTGAGGLPGALLGVSTNTIAAPAVGENVLDFSGVSVANGTVYWFGLVSNDSGNQIICPPLTNGIAQNSGTYASPSNPFGAAPSTLNFRYPIIVNISLPVPTGGTLPMMGV